MDGRGEQQERRGGETSPGASAWVAARPVGPASTLHDTLFRIAVRLRFLVPFCGLGTSCSCAPSSTGAVCGSPLDPLALHAMVCSRAQMCWRHDIVAECWAAICRDAGVAAHLKQKAVEFPPDADLRRESDVYCRGAGGDLPVHADVVVTSSAHCNGGRWEANGDGIAVARGLAANSGSGARRASDGHLRGSCPWRSSHRASGAHRPLRSWRAWPASRARSSRPRRATRLWPPPDASGDGALGWQRSHGAGGTGAPAANAARRRPPSGGP